MIKQFVVTTSMGKRLIAKAAASLETVLDAARERTLAIVAGTTNAYVAEEVLKVLGQAEGFDRDAFRRGLVVPSNFKQPDAVKEFPGDVIISKGKWLEGKTIFDVADDLQAGDVVLKGANALHQASREAGVYIGHPQAGTIGVAIQAVVGRRVRLIVPVGLEKRVDVSIGQLCRLLTDPGAEGPRMMALPGEVLTEIDALEMLTTCQVLHVAGGGVYGAEGSVWLAVEGDEEDVAEAEALMKELAAEPPYGA
jgi:hypothetical protein